MNSLPASAHFCGLLITFYKQFGPKSGPRACRSSSGSKLIDTDVIPEFFLKVNCEKYNDNNKKNQQESSSMQRVQLLILMLQLLLFSLFL